MQSDENCADASKRVEQIEPKLHIKWIQLLIVLEKKKLNYKLLDIIIETSNRPMCNKVKEINFEITYFKVLKINFLSK